MEALRRGASQETGVSVSSRQMSTSTVNIGPASPRFPTRSRSPVSTSKTISPTGLPFYRHTEKFGSSSLPPLSTANVKYLRDLDQANVAVAQMMDRMEPFPGSRWRGVVGFDMEWTVDLRMFQKKTGLIQVSANSSSEMDYLIIVVYLRFPILRQYYSSKSRPWIVSLIFICYQLQQYLFDSFPPQVEGLCRHVNSSFVN
jgi:hypothetical protein